MVKKKLLLTFLFMLCFSSCTSTANSNSEVTSTTLESTYEKTSDEPTRGSSEENLIKPSDGNVLENNLNFTFPEDKIIRTYVNAIYDNSLENGGGLYDLDFDGMCEYVWCTGGENNTEFYYVYKCIDEVPVQVGVIVQSLSLIHI